MPKICSLDNNNINSILYAGLYNNISCTTSNLIGIQDISIVVAKQNNFGNTNIVLEITPSSFLTTISFDLTFPKTLLNSFFNINGYTNIYKYPIHDLVCFSDDSITVTIKMTSRDNLFTNYTVILQN